MQAVSLKVSPWSLCFQTEAQKCQNASYVLGHSGTLLGFHLPQFMACCQHGLCPDSAEHGALVTSLLTHMHFGCHTCRTTRTVHAGHAHTIQCHPSNAAGSEVTACALVGHTEKGRIRGDMVNTSGSHNNYDQGSCTLHDSDWMHSVTRAHKG